MSERKGWKLEAIADSSRTLRAPNGAWLFNVSLDTLGMLGQMFLDEVEDANEMDDLREVLYD